MQTRLDFARLDRVAIFVCFFPGLSPVSLRPGRELCVQKRGCGRGAASAPTQELERKALGKFPEKQGALAEAESEVNLTARSQQNPAPSLG